MLAPRILDSRACGFDIGPTLPRVQDLVARPAAAVDGAELEAVDMHDHGPRGHDYETAGGLIQYEEYHPYGTTAYRAGDSGIDVSPRRYRYTGMEQDEETGLGYHTARYYAGWLGRWTASDPIGLGGGVNRFGYVEGRVGGSSDASGLDWPNHSVEISQTQAEADGVRRSTLTVSASVDLPVLGTVGFSLALSSESRALRSNLSIKDPPRSERPAAAASRSHARQSTGGAGTRKAVSSTLAKHEPDPARRVLEGAAKVAGGEITPGGRILAPYQPSDVPKTLGQYEAEVHLQEVEALESADSAYYDRHWTRSLVPGQALADLSHELDQAGSYFILGDESGFETRAYDARNSAAWTALDGFVLGSVKVKGGGKAAAEGTASEGAHTVHQGFRSFGAFKRAMGRAGPGKA